LRILDRQAARRLVDFLDERVVGETDPRSMGKAVRGRMPGLLWRYRVGKCRLTCDLQDLILVLLALQTGDRKDIS
jgi:mRNA interferase RelE/StbE